MPRVVATDVLTEAVILEGRVKEGETPKSCGVRLQAEVDWEMDQGGDST